MGGLVGVLLLAVAGGFAHVLYLVIYRGKKGLQQAKERIGKPFGVMFLFMSVAIFAYAFIIFLSTAVSSDSKMTLFQNILMYAWFPAYIALRITLERLGYVVGEIEDK